MRQLIASVTPACSNCNAPGRGDHPEPWTCTNCGATRPANIDKGVIWRQEKE